MSALVLEFLTPEPIAAPTRVDIAALEGVMLWPNNAEAQARALLAAICEYYRLRASADLLDRRDLLDLLEFQANAPRLAEITWSERYIDGIRAGRYLMEVVARISLGQSIKMKTVATKVAALPPAINVHTFENRIWRDYRRVAHFWAAYLHRAKPQPFPCALCDFREFIALAEGFRHLGETTNTKQSRKILDASSVRPPGEVDIFLLPEFELKPFPM